MLVVLTALHALLDFLWIHPLVPGKPQTCAQMLAMQATTLAVTLDESASLELGRPLILVSFASQAGMHLLLEQGCALSALQELGCET